MAADQTNSPSTRSRRRDLLELAGIFTLIMIVIWTPRPWQGLLWVVAAAAILYVAYVSFEGLRQMGLSTANLVNSLWAVALAAVLACGAVLLAERLHTLHMPDSPLTFARRYGLYVIWAAVQQIILQWVVLTRSLRLLQDATSAAALAAGLFAVAHLPNPVLSIVTLVFGLASCLLFVRYRNLVPLALGHAILGISISITVPGSIDHNMRVGIGYLTYVDNPALSSVDNPAFSRAVLSSKP